MAHTLRLNYYNESGSLLGYLDLANTGAPTTYKFYLRSDGYTPSMLKFKDQIQDSPLLDGAQLVDYRQAVQTETIVVDLFAASDASLQQALADLNSYMQYARLGQKNKAAGNPYRSMKLASNPKGTMTYTSMAEVIAMDVDLPSTYLSTDIVNRRVKGITITLTLAPYWTASVLNLISAQAISNGSGNYVQISGDTTTYTVTNAALTSNVATLTLGSHSLAVGDTIVASDVSLDAAFNGTFVITAVGATTISYAKTNANIASASSSGSVVAQYVKGTRSAPTRTEVAGGTSATNQLLTAVRKRGTPSNFVAQYWAKDALIAYGTVTNAALTSNVATLTIGAHLLNVGESVTVASVSLDAAFNGTYTITTKTATTISYALTHADIASASSSGTVTGRTAPRTSDTTLDGNDTNNGTRTTATGTSEVCTHRWLNTTNVADQYGAHQIRLRARSNTAGRYSARLRVGLYDGTNIVYPANGGYSKEEAVTIGTDSGNALAFPDIGSIQVPAIAANGATVYGLVYELYLTCSNTSGSPTCDVDGIFLFPTAEGEEGTGLCLAKFDLGSAASGVSSAFLNALNSQAPAYLANSSDVPTFPTFNLEGAPQWLEPLRAYRVYAALIDESTSSGNPRHDYTQTLTVTLDYEVRHGAEGRIV